MIPLSTRFEALSRLGLLPRNPVAYARGATHKEPPLAISTLDDAQRSALSSAMNFYARIARLTAYQTQTIRAEKPCAAPTAHILKSRSPVPSEEDVIAALASGEGLRVVFQPQFDLRTRGVIGAEALIRWHHPHLGEIAPSTLVPMVHRLGLDMLLFGFVKARAIDMLRHLQNAGAAVPIAINASAKTTCTPGLAALLGDRMQRAGLPTRLLKIELTEDIKAADSSRLAAALASIQAQGFTVSLDDFGSGFSTPNLLSLMLFDEVKIEASYVQTMDMSSASHGFIRELLEFSREFNFDVIAEGVQSEATARQLTDLGCPFAQGFALARPLEADLFSQKMTAKRKFAEKFQ